MKVYRLESTVFKNGRYGVFTEKGKAKLEPFFRIKYDALCNNTIVDTSKYPDLTENFWDTLSIIILSYIHQFPATYFGSGTWWAIDSIEEKYRDECFDCIMNWCFTEVTIDSFFDLER